MIVVESKDGRILMSNDNDWNENIQSFQPCDIALDR
jgi:hypothetical protein